MRKAVILAGGLGTRLWPLSRGQRPKQLLRLFGNSSLMRLAYERVAAVLPPHSIYVCAGQTHLPMIAEEVPEIPAANLIGEPTGRDTAAAIGLTAAVLNQHDPNTVMGVFTADHLIRPVAKFQAAVEQAYQAVERHPEYLATFGITPKFPATSFGYLERGQPVDNGVFRVARFAEKPSAAVAAQYLSEGKYFWNSGMFVWRTSTLLELMQKFLPQTHEAVIDIARDWGKPSGEARLAALYPGLQRISIDFAVMERAPNVLMVELNCEWADVGSWTALGEVLPADGQGNVNAAGRSMHLGSSGNIVVSEDRDHLIATVGVQDLIIVRTADATLVCSARDAQGLKELVAKVQTQWPDQYA